jgi:predicted lipoprotein with Yx(FWY)xxD motif
VSAGATPFLTTLGSVRKVASTIPANGDVNPYGIAFVPASVGKLQAGRLLVSNFNAREGAKESGQGTGSTIVQVSSAGKVTPFAQLDSKALPGPCPGGVGLTTALDVLPGGYVIVGSLPTTNGKSATAKYGCLIVLDSQGKAIKTIASSNIQGPWDSTARSEGGRTTLFVSNALNGGPVKGEKTINNSTVVRIELESGEGTPPRVTSEQIVAEGIPWVDSAEALVLGPTGLALGSGGTLYVASTQDDRILAIPQAATRSTPIANGGTVLTEGGHLKEPLGMALAPNGDIITTNGGDGNMVETTPAGRQVAVRTADTKTGAGSLFGLAIDPSGSGIYFVDDGENALELLSAAASASAPASALVKTASSSLGTILVDAQGMTLYHLGGEQNGKFICTGACLSVWHPLTVSAAATPAGAGVKLGTVKRPEGTSQVTYNGTPLYTFAQDRQPGETNGQGIKDVGTWSAVTTMATAAKSQTSTSSEEGGGYHY